MDFGAVSLAIRDVAAEEVTPRFRRLLASEVSENTRGEIVTEADSACERALTQRLREIYDIPVVGEEAAKAEPSLLALIGSAGAVWLVDPLDGTSNFVAGSHDYAVMVALVEAGRTVASWMWHPPAEVMAHAILGGGARLNDKLLSAAAPGRAAADLRGVLKRRFLPEGLVARAAADLGILATASEGRTCAGLDYPDLVAGDVDFLAYWRTLPWDHAPGVLFAQQAGLRAQRPDGAAYQPGDDRVGLIVSHPSVWDAVRSSLFADP